MFEKLVQAMRQGPQLAQLQKSLGKSMSNASLKRGIAKDFNTMMKYGNTNGSSPEQTSGRRRSITKADLQEEARKSVSPSRSSPTRKTLQVTAGLLYSSNDEEDPWNQKKIKDEMKKLADYNIDPRDVDELISRVADSNKSPKIEIMNFAMQKIQQLEGRKSRKISNHEKDRIIM
jgi:hypothetical protein